MRLRVTVNDGIGKKLDSIAACVGMTANQLAAKLVYAYTLDPVAFENVTSLTVKRRLELKEKEKEQNI